MPVVKIADNVHYIGVMDSDLKVFDIIMRTEHGTTYNSYLITGEKNVVIETVKAGFTDEFISNIKQVMDPKDIDYIILNHTEPDHTGALRRLLEEAPNAVVYASRGALNFLTNILNEEFSSHTVKDGETLSLGEKSIRFISAPFLHWPDTIFSYLPEENMLFSCDVFGSHFCDERIFDDLVGEFHYDFAYYYSHIMRPFKEHVLKACEKLSELEIKMLCPSHGPVLRTDIRKYIDEYCRLSQVKKAGKNAIIAYVSAYGNTRLMAEKVREGLISKGVDVKLMEAVEIDIGSFLDDFERADALILGSPTINGDALKPIHDILSSLATVKIKGKLGAAFGSYGWSGEGVDILNQRMRSIKLTVVEPGMKVKFVPTKEDLKECVSFGEELGGRINAL